MPNYHGPHPQCILDEVQAQWACGRSVRSPPNSLPIADLWGGKYAKKCGSAKVWNAGYTGVKQGKGIREQGFA